MCVRKIISCACAWVFLIVGPGCKRSESGQNQANTGPPNNEPVAIIHWMGAKQVSSQPNAAGFLKIWRLAETEKLRAQTLDKLALAPWTLRATNQSAVTNSAALVRANPSAALLRPLLDDLVQQECYLEIRDAGTAGCQLGLAVRLDAKRSGAWETNLGSVFESATGTRRTPTQTPGNRGWSVRANGSSPALSPALRHAELVQVGEWTIFGMALDQNPVFSEILGRVQAKQTPLATPATAEWLQVACDLRRLCSALSWGPALPPGWPRISFGVNGDGTSVLTKGQLSFSKPLPFETEPWIIPTNLIHEPLHSFTAVQGLKAWVSSMPAWSDLRAGPAPNQLFCWGQGGSPFLDYAAAPLADSSSAMQKLGPKVMDELNPLLATNGMGKWEHSGKTDGIAWNRVPIINPFIQSISQPQGNYLLAGLSPLAVTNSKAPFGTLQDLVSRSNVVYLDRELTGPRIEAWMFVGQLFRITLRRTQLSSEALTVQWFKVVGPTLGETLTTITKTGPATLSFDRKSGFGLTGIEFHLLADWLESARFPYETHTEIAKLPPRRFGTRTGAGPAEKRGVLAR
jgi:hypothetical protein